MYLDAEGNVVPGLSTSGYKAIGVPGSVAGLVYAQKHFGKLTLKQDMAPAIRLAKDGFVLTEEEAERLHSNSWRSFRNPAASSSVTGLRERRRDLHAARSGAHAGADCGRSGRVLSRQDGGGAGGAFPAHGGLLTEADLAAYKVADRTTLRGTFKTHGRTYDVITSPPPCSGGIVLLETLNILAGYDLRSSAATARRRRFT